MNKTSGIWLSALSGLVMHATPAWPADLGRGLVARGWWGEEPVGLTTDTAIAGQAWRPLAVAAAAEDGAGAPVSDGGGGEDPPASLYTRLNILAYGVTQSLKDSPLNPNNTMDMPRRQAAVEIRPDFDLEAGRWEFALKPRAQTTWESWDEGPHKDDSQIHSNAYVNEGFVRFRPVDELMLSLGRETLQWGPSVIMSSSNPFNRDNGRNNPRVEQPGLDFVRAVWIPNGTWSLSAIANTGKGRLEDSSRIPSAQLSVTLPALPAFLFLPALPSIQVPVGRTPAGPRSDDFERTYALKLDYTGQNGYFSVIPSYRRHDQSRLGFFSGWSASEAMLLYAEGSVGSKDERLFQLGGSYTLLAGPTINVEYLRNQEGCVDKSMVECLQAGDLKRRNVFYRRDYVMLQYTDTELVHDLSINLRFIHNLNDHSSRLIGIFEYELGDHIQLYLIANGFTGSTKTEFGSLLRSSAFIGAAYTF